MLEAQWHQEEKGAAKAVTLDAKAIPSRFFMPARSKRKRVRAESLCLFDARGKTSGVADVGGRRQREQPLFLLAWNRETGDEVL